MPGDKAPAGEPAACTGALAVVAAAGPGSGATVRDGGEEFTATSSPSSTSYRAALLRLKYWGLFGKSRLGRGATFQTGPSRLRAREGHVGDAAGCAHGLHCRESLVEPFQAVPQPHSTA